MVGTKGGFTFLASKAFQSISCKINQLVFSFPSLFLYDPIQKMVASTHPEEVMLFYILSIFLSSSKTSLWISS